MNAVLDIYDERQPGAKRELRHRLELPIERLTARDLIRCRIEADVAIHNAAERARFDADIAPDRDAPNEWLVMPGAVERALNGTRGAYGSGRRPAKSMNLIESDPL